MDTGMAEAGSCWLCRYGSDKIAEQIHNLIINNIHVMSTEQIIEQCEYVLQDAFERRNAPPEVRTGATQADIAKHIREHMLHPNVTLAMTLRSLLEVNDSMRNQICSQDPETHQTIIDAGHVKNYLAVTSQILSIYKMGESSKLMFARTKETGKEDSEK